MLPKKERIFTEEFFFDGLNYMDFQILSCIEEAKSPLGAWVIKEKMDEIGVEISTTTIGRRLKALEAQGFLMQCSNLGRILTPKGRRHLEHVNQFLSRSRLTQDMIEKISITHYLELVSIYQARRGLEVEAARLAAIHATPEEVEELRKNTQRYKLISKEGFTDAEVLDTSLKFHYIVAGMCRNYFITSILNMILNENAQFEKKLKNPIIYESSGEYALEHDKIADAIAIGDADTAAALMYEHMTSIIDRENSQIGFMEPDGG